MVFFTSPSQYNLNINLYIVHTILLDGPEKSLAQCKIILQYIEIYRGKQPVSPYTMYAGGELFKFNPNYVCSKCLPFSWHLNDIGIFPQENVTTEAITESEFLLRLSEERLLESALNTCTPNEKLHPISIV